MADRRFDSGFRTSPTDAAGLVLEDDDIVYVVQPDGTRVQVATGGGGAFLQLESGSSPEKISSLTDGSPLQGTDEFVVARAGGNVKIPGAALSGAPLFAVVHLSTLVTDWDGTAVPFDIVDSDSAGLWDAVNHQFTAKVAGWYRITAFGTENGGGINVTAADDNIEHDAWAQITGPGNNILVAIFDQSGITGGFWGMPPIVGITHLMLGDSVYIAGDGGVGWFVEPGYSAALELLVAT